MKKIIFKSIKKLHYVGLLITVLFFCCSEPTESFKSKATSVAKPKPEPVITVKDITNGSEPNEFEYQITNTGNEVLKLTNLPYIVLTGINESAFSIIQQPLKQEIETGKSITFKIKLDPDTPGTKTANINIPNNSKNTPFICSISKNALQYTLTINPNDRGDATPSITFFNELNTTINAEPNNGFYFYKWKVVSGNVTIGQPNSRITTIKVKGGNAVIKPLIYVFDPNQAPDVNLDAIQSLGSHDYAFINLDKEWDEARDFCSANGGYLACITSSAENTFVHNMSGGSIWLGGHRVSDVPQIFGWISGEAFNYENWDSGEPNNDDGEDNIEMRSNGEWNDKEGDSDRNFVCEWN